MTKPKLMQVVVLSNRKEYRDLFVQLALPSILAQSKSANPKFDFIHKMTVSKVFVANGIGYRIGVKNNL